jgi:hypothetical protein
MIEGAHTGNFNDMVKTTGQWVAGLAKLNPKLAPYLHNENVGLKWTKARKGEKKEVYTANTSSETLGILIYGRMRVDFLEPESSLVLEKEGDFLFLAKDVFHRYEFLEDSLVISLRYPAVDDQVRK